jgi:hypothetical protein
MTAPTGLKMLFATIFAAMLVCTLVASSHQSLLHWTGLSGGADRYWTGATLLDAYCGFITFYVWVYYKESSAVVRLGWFVAIMLLGNMAMSAYVLKELARLRPGEPLSQLLLARPPRGRAS